MQDCYAGDIGDFGKFALLRKLAKGRRLGICWYRPEGEEGKASKRRFEYLKRGDDYRELDCKLFDAFTEYQDRGVETLERLLREKGLLEVERFHGEECPRDLHERTRWAREMVRCMDGLDLVFLDPDNGLAPKCLGRSHASWAEVVALRARGRALVVYQHAARGDAEKAFCRLSSRLRLAGFDRVDAVRLSAYSARFFLLLDGNAELRRRLRGVRRVLGQQGEAVQ